LASVTVNPKSVRTFESEAAFEAWLKKHHDSATEIWIKIFKKASGTPSIDANQAIDVALCWGWIDGIRKSFDADAFLQRYTPRNAKSRWSQLNRDRVARLRKAGRMTAHGQRQVDAAKADGRWEAAYASPKTMQLPEDFLAAVRKQPRALRSFESLSKTYLFSIAYRLQNFKTEAGRSAAMAKMLERLGAGMLPFETPLRPGDTLTSTTPKRKRKS
jgi:uncharacterized protein YdeI (YjbR/CyaY-like superfamily)